MPLNFETSKGFQRGFSGGCLLCRVVSWFWHVKNITLFVWKNISTNFEFIFSYCWMLESSYFWRDPKKTSLKTAPQKTPGQNKRNARFPIYEGRQVTWCVQSFHWWVWRHHPDSRQWYGQLSNEPDKQLVTEIDYWQYIYIFKVDEGYLCREIRLELEQILIYLWECTACNFSKS